MPGTLCPAAAGVCAAAGAEGGAGAGAAAAAGCGVGCGASSAGLGGGLAPTSLACTQKSEAYREKAQYDEQASRARRSRCDGRFTVNNPLHAGICMLCHACA
jgi:hypothetical protein